MSGYRNAFRVFVGVAFGLAAAVFWVDNPTPVPVKFALWELAEPLPLWLIVVVALVVGMVFPRLLLFRGVFGEYLERRRLRKRVVHLENEVMQLRRLPFEGLDTTAIAAEGRTDDQQLEPMAPVTAGLQPEVGPPPHRPVLPPVHPEILPRDEPAPAATNAPAGDPYANLFDDPDPALSAVEDAEIAEAGG